MLILPGGGQQKEKHGPNNIEHIYDPKTVWYNFGVPLHPGAERYYREVG